MYEKPLEGAEFSGFLVSFSTNLLQQSITVEVDELRLTSDTTSRSTIRAEFQEVVYLKAITDLKIMSENEIDVFEERTAGEMIASMERLEKGWFNLVTEMGEIIIKSPAEEAPRLRYFVLRSSSVKADWLCVDATFSPIRRKIDSTHGPNEDLRA